MTLNSNGKEKTPQRIRGGHRVLSHLINHPDHNFTVHDLAMATGWTAASIPTAITRFMDQYPNLRRTGRGVYMWCSDQDAPVQNPDAPELEPESEPVRAAGTGEPGEMLISVLRRNDKKILVRDETTGDMYVMTPFSF